MKSQFLIITCKQKDELEIPEHGKLVLRIGDKKGEVKKLSRLEWRRLKWG